MEAEGRYTLVGTVVLTVLGLLAVALAWLAGGTDHASYQTYTIYFRHQTMEGLAVGGPVKMRGIKVGDVDSYHFVIGAQEAVGVRVKIDAGVPVRSSASAYVKRNLVTGIAAIEITNRDNTSPMLT
jgi:phospholipid/cholesterol/gamma-HCH transport system substrate-binding protein